MAVAKKGQMFDRVPINPPTHNIFPLTHEVLATMKFIETRPIMCRPVNPSERYKVSLSSFIRAMPMQAPMMGEVNVYAHAFFVPTRLMYRQKDWEDFITGGRDGKEDKTPKMMRVQDVLKATYVYNNDVSSMKGFMGEKSLWAYLGYPSIVGLGDATLEKIGAVHGEGVDSSQVVTYEPFLGYKMIYEDYYRDQNLVDDNEYLRDVIENKMGIMTYSEVEEFVDNDMMRYFNRALEKDYFTSALPQPQRGPDVPIPFKATLDVQPTYKDPYLPTTQVINGEIGFDGMEQLDKFGYLRRGSHPYDIAIVTGQQTVSNDVEGNTVVHNGDDLAFVRIATDDVANNLTVNQIGQMSATINDLRFAIRLQEFYELSARVGNRYKEMIVGHFGVFTPDYRLDRPQYLGGIKTPLRISQVLQTSETNETALGDMAGHGISAGQGFMFDFTAYEHGWLYILVSILPRTSYYQGMPRWLTREDRLDYYWDKFANLGEQEVKQGELFYNFDTPSGPDEENDVTFGYQSRYSELKYMNNRVLGDFQGNLDYWHLAQKLDIRTAILSNAFVTGQYGNYNRIFAYGTNQSKLVDPFLCDFKIDMTGSLPMPIFGVPKL